MSTISLSRWARKSKKSMDSTRLKNYLMDSTDAEGNVVTIYSLPDSLVLYIFSFLDAREVTRIIRTCQWWKEIGQDECLWRDLAHKEWGERCAKAPFVNSWIEEYRRLHSHAPLILSEELFGHSDEIYHVSFSHNGKYFATTGKDGAVKVWEIGCPTMLKYSYNLKEEAGWNYTRYSTFNKEDTNLLVSGLKYHCGWVAWFSLAEGFRITWTDVMTPQGIRGAWLSNHRLLYGLQSATGETVSLCVETEDTSGNHPEDGEPQEIQEITFDVKIRIQFLNVVRRKQMFEDDCYFDSYNTYRNSQFNTNSDFTQNRNRMDNGQFVTSNSDGYFLVFATGYCHALNQIGIKYIPKDKVKTAVPSNGERHPRHPVIHRRRQSVKRKQNAHCDHLIDLHGQIIGIRVSVNSRYLVINMRRWLEEPGDLDPYEQPDISNDMEIRILDLLTLRVQPTVYRGHGAVTDTESFCYCFGDANRDFVVCGSESNQAYLWDRHSGVLLTKYNHLMAGVSAAAINPLDQEFVVSVGDDQVVRVWRSRVNQKKFEKESSFNNRKLYTN